MARPPLPPEFNVDEGASDLIFPGPPHLNIEFGGQGGGGNESHLGSKFKFSIFRLRSFFFTCLLNIGVILESILD